MQLQDYPTLLEAAQKMGRQQALINAVVAIKAGVESGSIRNVVLNDAKSDLGRIIYSAWTSTARPAILESRERWSDNERKLLDFVYMSSLNDVLVAKRKVERSRATGPVVDLLRNFVAEIAPLAEAAADLKSKVIKGREPSVAPARPENPSKDVKTCPCCFRSIAVRDNKMVHHGYERPGDGHQTSSCFGINYPPLEVSVEGLDWMISWTEESVERKKKELEAVGVADEVSILFGIRVETYRKGEPKWDWAVRWAKSDLENEISVKNSRLTFYRGVRKDWQPGKVSLPDPNVEDIEEARLLSLISGSV